MLRKGGGKGGFACKGRSNEVYSIYMTGKGGGAGLLKNATSNDHDMQLIQLINPPNSGSKMFSKYLAMIIQKYVFT